jgi:hypothetical protein
MKQDKINHTLIGCGVAFIVGIVTYLMQQDEFGNVAGSAAWAGVFAALVSAALAGGVKEWCDMHTSGNKWDWKDFAATMVGGVVAALVIIGIHFGKG